MLAELNGYPNGSEHLPDYRIVPVRSRGDFFGWCIIRDQLLPTDHLPAVLREKLEYHRFEDSVGTLEAFLKAGSQNLSSPWGEAVVAYYRANPGVGFGGCQLNEAHKVLPAALVDGVLHAVRGRLLEFLLQLGEDRPNLKQNENAVSEVSAEKVEAFVDRYIFNGCVIGGDMAMSKQEVRAGGDLTVGRDFVVAEAIENSFNKVARSQASEEICSTLKELGEAVQEMCTQLSQDKAEEAAQDFDALATEVAKPAPRKRWLETAVDGLKQTAATVARIGPVVISLADKVMKLFA